MIRFATAILAALVLVAVPGLSRADLIGVDLELPLISSDSPGYYNYDAATDLLTSDAYSVAITFDGSSRLNIVPRGSYRAAFYVDQNGNFAGGVDGADLTITGDVFYGGSQYSGVLVQGEVMDFGWLRTNTGDFLFDFTFRFTGGALAPFYAAYDYLGADSSRSPALTNTFTGGWSQSHGGVRVKSDTAPAVPEPSALILLGCGLLGMGLFNHRRRKG